MVPVFKFQNEITAQIKRIVREDADGDKQTTDHKTIFSEMLKSDLPKEELSLDRLKHEALSITGGGVDTVKNALVTASYAIISNPAIHKQMHAELVEAMPDPNKPLTVPEFERLPYLNAIVQESLRLSYGITQRLQRVDPLFPVTFQNYTIPPNTPFSMTSYIQHRNPLVFPSPSTFNPDRWLRLTNPPSSSSERSVVNSTIAPSTGKPLSRYLVAFGRGPRSCLGQNFAMAQLFLYLGTMFRRCEFELFETGEREIEMVSNYFAPFPEAGTKGLRVRVK
ncbi:MAG: hypothetical protein Q9171_002251 [Xanthocarpia ochracea]